jgi:hypothetical protein
MADVDARGGAFFLEDLLLPAQERQARMWDMGPAATRTIVLAGAASLHFTSSPHKGPVRPLAVWCHRERKKSFYSRFRGAKPLCSERAKRVSHANGARRRSGARESV